jgi:hypothetical protein
MNQVFSLVIRVGLTTIAGFVLGSVYIVRCNQFVTSSDSLQACFAFGGSMMGVGAGINARKKGRDEGFLEGYDTLNPNLRPPVEQLPETVAKSVIGGLLRRK